jgi:GTP-binding protein
MQFVDEASIEVHAGDGGPGIVSFRREAQVPLGGPDGGNGGKGGDVVLEADDGTATLLDHRYRRWYKAPKGGSGGPSNRTGRGGEDLLIPVPLGTIISDEETGEILADLSTHGERLVVAQGGRGGKGNAHFTSSRRQAPRMAQEGEAGVHRVLALSLKLVADVGLVGLPNAGKSTFIRAISASRARVAAYPFTTLVPNLGVVRVDERTFVVADIPGLVAGAHQGQGLGDRFLKHVERTRVLVHLVSLSPDAVPPLKAFDVITTELAAHSPELAKRPQIVVLNKIDVLEDRYELELWRDAFRERGVEVLTASGLTRENVTEVLRAVVGLLSDAAPEAPEPTPWSPV